MTKYATRAAISLVAAVALVITGCAAQPDQTSGGTLRAGGPYSPNNLDPGVTVIENAPLSQNYMGLLASYSPDGFDEGDRLTDDALAPQLAETIEVSADNMKVQVKLRDNVVSDRGNTLSTRDVDWTFDRIFAGEGLPALLLKIANVDPEDPITVVDDLNFTINLKAPSPILLKTLDQGSMGIFDSEAAKAHASNEDPWAKEWLKNNVASYGPYNLGKFTPGKSITLEASQTYWAGAPAMERIVWTAIPEGTTRTQLLIGGSLDYAWSLPLTDFSALEDTKDLKTYITNVAAASNLVLNQTQPPFDNPLVRQAVRAALDREGIASVVAPGTGTAALGCSPGELPMNGFAGMGQAKANLEEARRLLKEAGYPDGFTASLVFSPADAPEARGSARMVQSQLAEVGIDIQLNEQANEGQFIEIISAKSENAYIGNSGLFVNDPGFFFSVFFKSTSSSNRSGFANENFDSEATLAMSTLGEDRQRHLLAACNIFKEETPSILLVNVPRLTAVASNVSGVYNYPYSNPHLSDLKFND